jgi:hypothetical protein
VDNATSPNHQIIWFLQKAEPNWTCLVTHMLCFLCVCWGGRLIFKSGLRQMKRKIWAKLSFSSFRKRQEEAFPEFESYFRARCFIWVVWYCLSFWVCFIYLFLFGFVLISFGTVGSVGGEGGE